MSASVVVAGAHTSCVADAQRILAAVPGVRVVATATSCAQAGALLRALEPDVAVVDLALVSLSEHFQTGWGPVSRATRIVVIGRDAHLGCARCLLAQGAAAYVPFSQLAERLVPAVLNSSSTSPAAGSTAAATAGESPSPIPYETPSMQMTCSAAGRRPSARPSSTASAGPTPCVDAAPTMAGSGPAVAST